MSNQQHISSKSGLPPGIPIYIGERIPINTNISVIRYDANTIYEENTIDPEKIIQKISPSEVIWVQISGLSNSTLIENICNSFNIHPLVTEDILNTKNRSKVEDFETYLFTILPKISFTDDKYNEEQINFILFNQILISFSESENPFFPIIEQIHHQNGKIRQFGSDYLMYTLIDNIADDYFVVLEHLEDDSDELDAVALTISSQETITHIQTFKRDLVWFRRCVWSLRDTITHLERTNSHLVSLSTHMYIRDVYDHTLKLAEEVDVLRDIAEGLMEIYLTNLSNNTNEIMKVLTLIAVIFIPLSFITSFYGMNFEYMPELHHSLGYPIVIVTMALVTISMILFFKKKKWL